MLLNVQECQVALIDYQAKLMPAIAEGAQVLAAARRLARMAQLVDVPVWATEQSPDKLGATDAELAALCTRIVPKMAFSAAAVLEPLLAPAPKEAPAPKGNARSLPKHLRKAPEPERGCIIIAGCETHVCLLQTALELLEAEWDVCVAVDACGSRDTRQRDAAFDRMAAAGCELVTTEMAGFEWLRDSTHPQFRAFQAIVK
ncbi:MAG: isochorismatase family protein [Ottowia sp.]|nr:isochorismatase family protein [Ottowia sp.]